MSTEKPLQWHALKAIVHYEGAYVERRPGMVARTTEAHEAVMLDFDAEGNLLGVEVLGSPKTIEEGEQK